MNCHLEFITVSVEWCCRVKWWKLHSNSGRWGLFQIMFLFNAYCFFLKLYLRVRTCICNFHFPHGDKCIRGIVHIFVIFSAKYEIFHNLQLLQRTLPSNFTKYKNIKNTKKYKIFRNLQLLQQLYIVDILTTEISLGHIFLDEFEILDIFDSSYLIWSCFL